MADFTKYTLRNFVDDFASTYPWTISYSEITAPPAGGEPNRLVFVRTQGVPYGDSRAVGNEINRKFEVTIERGQSAVGESLMEYWVGIGESNSYEPVSYTRTLTLQFENRLDKAVTIKFKHRKEEADSTETILLAPGAAGRLIPLSDLDPNKEAYSFTLDG